GDDLADHLESEHLLPPAGSNHVADRVPEDGAADRRRHDEREGYPALERQDPAEDDGQLAREEETEESRGFEGRQGEDERVGSTPVEVQDEADYPRHRKSFILRRLGGRLGTLPRLEALRGLDGRLGTLPAH